MLVKAPMKSSIENAIESAMKEAYKAALDASKNEDHENFSIDNVADKFAAKAKKCASDIADAIETYIKGAQLMIPSGMSFVPAPTLISPMGPCSGTITFTAPFAVPNCLQ